MNSITFEFYGDVSLSLIEDGENLTVESHRLCDDGIHSHSRNFHDPESLADYLTELEIRGKNRRQA